MENNFNERTMRFQDADWYISGPQNIIIGGTGGIGSWVALLLGRIGHNLFLFDDDVIDNSNMAGQFYSSNQIGLNKAEATAENVFDFCNIKPSYFGKYTESSLSSPIVFSCFDNMAARKIMFENWAKLEDREVFVDGRMLAETGMIYLVQKGQEEAYRKELFDDSEVEDAPCSFKATSHCGAFIASLMVANFNNYLANKQLQGDYRIIEFRIDFELPMLNIEAKSIQSELLTETI
jgi:molybdopterin/thiamine biosynthesis adenylyltransferase